MRISTQQQFQRNIDDIQRSQSRIADLQEQISSGKRVRTPSDDPVAAAQIVKLERELSQFQKYNDNVNVTQLRLQLEESTLDSLNTSTDRLRELALSAGSDVLNDTDRQTIATEMIQIREYMAGLMNTQDAEGEYLFAGNLGNTQPYTQNADGTYTYNGDDGQRVIQVGAELFIPSNDSGQFLFENIDGPLSVQLSGQAVFNAAQQMPPVEPFVRNTSFANVEAEDAFQAATQGLGDITIRVTEPTPNNFEYSVFDSSGQPVNDAAGNPLTNIAVGDLSTTPADVNILGMDLQLHPPADLASANEVTISAAPTQMNILDSITELATVLQQPIGNDEQGAAKDAAVARALEQFVESAEHNAEATATVGSRLRSLDNVATSNVDRELFTQQALSRLQDADLASVISEFQLEQTALQAGLQTFSQVTSLSLFNFIQ